jgi:uncharacterized membrane protein YeiH
LAAISAGAIQGGLLADRETGTRHLDVMGLAIVGVVTGLGGGIVRDILLSQPLAALRTSYLSTAVASAVLAVALRNVVQRMSAVVEAVDAVSLALFMLMGALKATDLHYGVAPTLFVAVAACTGGGVLRDLLLRRPVALLEVGSLYAVAALAGAALLLALDAAGLPQSASATLAATCTLLVRFLAIRFKWETPEASVLSRPFQRLVSWPRRSRGSRH